MYSRTVVTANRGDKRYRLTHVRCATELFELSIGISLEYLVTLIKVTGICKVNKLCIYST